MNPLSRERRGLSSFAPTFNPPLSQQPNLSTTPIDARDGNVLPVHVGPPTAANNASNWWPDPSARALQHSTFHSVHIGLPSSNGWPDQPSINVPHHTSQPVNLPHQSSSRTVQDSSTVKKPRKKATKHRKRTTPPGPAGVWFQSQRHAKKHKGAPQGENNSSQGRNDDDPNKSDEDEAAVLDITSNPAWMCMQLDVGMKTPYLPPYYGVGQRYECLRQHVPSEYALLPEIQQGLYDLRLTEKSLIVVVHAVNCHGHFDWTVELRDECGARIKAWLEPKLVQREQEESRHTRLGVVWCLRDVTMAVTVDGSHPDGSSKVERMLLISESKIVKTWTPQQATNGEFSDKAYKEWLEQRTSMLDGDIYAAVQDEEEEEEVENTQEDPARNGTIYMVDNEDSAEEIAPPSARIALEQSHRDSRGAFSAVRDRRRIHSTQPQTPFQTVGYSQTTASGGNRGRSNSSQPPMSSLLVGTGQSQRRSHLQQPPASTQISETVRNRQRSSFGAARNQPRSNSPQPSMPSQSVIPGNSVSQSCSNSAVPASSSRPSASQPTASSKLAPPSLSQQGLDLSMFAASSKASTSRCVTPTTMQKNLPEISSGSCVNTAAIHSHAERQRTPPGRPNANDGDTTGNKSPTIKQPHTSAATEENGLMDGAGCGFIPRPQSEPASKDTTFAHTQGRNLEPRIFESSRAIRETKSSPNQPRVSRSDSQQRPIAKGIQKPSSQQASSALWSMQDDSLMDLFEDDEKENVIAEEVDSADACVDAVDQPSESKDTHSKNLSNEERVTTKPPQSSLFQVGGFDGIDMDELFDEDDDDS